MIGYRGALIEKRLVRAHALRGVSALALLAAGLAAATPAAAQQGSPGSAACPLAGDGTVTCTGDLTSFRSVDDARLRTLIIRDLNGPMTGFTSTAGYTPPIILVEAENDLTIDLAANVQITGDRLALDSFARHSAIHVSFEPAQLRTAIFNNAATLDVRYLERGSFADIQGGGAVFLDAGSLAINNSGTIRVTSDQRLVRSYARFPNGLIADAVNSVALTNSGLITAQAELAKTVVLRAASVSLVNSGTINSQFADSLPLLMISESANGTPLAIDFDNSGTLSGTNLVTRTGGNNNNQNTNSYLLQYGAGSIAFRNTGLIEGMSLNIEQQVAAGIDQVLDIANEGQLTRSSIDLRNRITVAGIALPTTPGADVPEPQSGEFYLYRATPARPTGEARNVTFSLSNTGTLSDSELEITVEGTGIVSADLTNSGGGSAFDLLTQATGADARARTVNSANLAGVNLVASARSFDADGVATAVLENQGRLVHGIFGVNMSSFAIGGSNADARLINDGEIGAAAAPVTGRTRAAIELRASGASATGDLVNTGDVVNGVLTATSDTDNLGAAPALRLENSGDITNLVLGDMALLASSTRTLEVVNSGAIFIQHDDTAVDQFGTSYFPSGIGISASQGEMGSRTTTSSTLVPGSRDVFGGLGRQPFGDQLRVTNSGAVTIDGEGDFNWGVALRAYSDILLDNSGAIAMRGERLSTGRADRGDGFDLVGVLVNGYSDLSFDGNAAITLEAVDSGPAGAAILLIERSFDAALPGTRDASYDAAADTNSRFEVNLTANVSASGADQFGLFGYLGLRDDGSITTGRRNTDDLAGFQFSNNAATIAIDVASGVSLTGGGGIGSAIAIQGTGNLLVTNAGSIIGRGGSESAAIHASSSAQLDPYMQFSRAAQVFLPDRFVTLRDMVNTGIVRSNAGHGIWAELGAIVNLTNRGLIHGGVASVRALRTSSILNDTGGTLDGRIRLEGAGSTLVNEGIIRVSTPGAVTHQINGGFSQGAGGTLALRHGDLMNVTGNFALNGDLNLALGAPNPDPIFTVGGNLTLDGRLNVTDAGGFGDGVYRLFDYAGALTNNGLVLSPLPGGANGNVQTAVAGQVNLVVGGAGPDLSIQFWDGADTAPDGNVDGGIGTWNADASNWTSADGNFNAPWAGNFAVFQNTGGAVTVEGAQSVTGMQFTANGYRLTAGANGSILLNAAETIVRVDPNVTAELALPLAGTGALVKRDAGTLILSGVNAYSGGTVIREGVLQAAADNALGAGGVTLDGGTLRFAAAATSARGFTIGADGGTIDAPNALTLSGAIGGGGALTKAGAGTLTLSGNSAGYTGTTNINAGTLSVTGSLGGSLIVQSGGRLLGTGTLGDVTIASGGILAPGGSIGTLSASGNVTFNAGSFYDLELAAAGGTDLLAVTGTATIQGGTIRVTALDPETQYVDGRAYTFLTAAGGRTGTFAGLTETSAFLDFTLGYTATSALITVTVLRTFPDVAATFNQRQASAALAAFGQTAGSDSLAVYNQLLLLDGDAARAAFDAASGEIYPVLIASELRRGGGLAARFIARGHARSGEGWGLWGGASGHDGRTDPDGNGARNTRDGIGGELGVDHAGPGNAWAIGFGGGYDDGDVTLRDRASQAEADGWHLGFYARYGSGGAGFTATIGGAWAQAEADVTRNIAFGTLARTATARVDVDSWALGGELRYGFALGGGWAAGPEARIVHAEADLGSVAETGATSLNLSGGDGNDDDRTRYGGGLFARWEGAQGSLDASVSWLHGGGTPTELGLVMAGAPAVPYRVRSARGDGDSAAFTLAGALELGGGWALGVNAEAAFGSRERSLQGNATLGWRF